MIAVTFSNNSGFALVSPMVGYITADEFHATGFPVSSNLKRVRSTDRTISANGEHSEKGE